MRVASDGKFSRVYTSVTWISRTVTGLAAVSSVFALLELLSEQEAIVAGAGVGDKQYYCTADGAEDSLCVKEQLRKLPDPSFLLGPTSKSPATAAPAAAADTQMSSSSRGSKGKETAAATLIECDPLNDVFTDIDGEYTHHYPQHNTAPSTPR